MDVLNRTMDARNFDHALLGNYPSQVSLIPQQLLPSGSRKDCIRLRGLPYEAQVEQILEFLGENSKNIVFQGVHMVYNAQGQPSGEAFIQMDSEQSAALAATHRHHKYMTCINPQSQVKKQRYIEVFQCSIDDMNMVLTGGVPNIQRPLLSPGGSLLPPPYGPYPYGMDHGNPQVLPAAVTAAATAAAAAALSPAARVPASFYPHPIIYWPYPSPPVSPTTYYAHSGPMVIGGDRGNDARKQSLH